MVDAGRVFGEVAGAGAGAAGAIVGGGAGGDQPRQRVLAQLGAGRQGDGLLQRHHRAGHVAQAVHAQAAELERRQAGARIARVAGSAAPGRSARPRPSDRRATGRAPARTARARRRPAGRVRAATWAFSGAAARGAGASTSASGALPSPASASVFVTCDQLWPASMRTISAPGPAPRTSTVPRSTRTSTRAPPSASSFATENRVPTTRTSTPPAATTNDRPGRCVTSHAMRPRASTSFSADGVLSPTSTRDRGSTFRLEPSVSVTDSASAAVSSCAPSHADATVPCAPGSITRVRTHDDATAHRRAHRRRSPTPSRAPASARRAAPTPGPTAGRPGLRTDPPARDAPTYRRDRSRNSSAVFKRRFTVESPNAPSAARSPAPRARPPAAAPARCAPGPAARR